jgi:hypothetical protein
MQNSELFTLKTYESDWLLRAQKDTVSYLEYNTGTTPARSFVCSLVKPLRGKKITYFTTTSVSLPSHSVSRQPYYKQRVFAHTNNFASHYSFGTPVKHGRVIMGIAATKTGHCGGKITSWNIYVNIYTRVVFLWV